MKATSRKQTERAAGESGKPRRDWGANKIFFLVTTNSRLHRSFARTNLSLLAYAPNNTARYADYCIESGL